MLSGQVPTWLYGIWVLEDSSIYHPNPDHTNRLLLRRVRFRDMQTMAHQVKTRKRPPLGHSRRLLSVSGTCTVGGSYVSSAVMSSSSIAIKPYVPPTISTSSSQTVKYDPTPLELLNARGNPQVSGYYSGTSAPIGVCRLEPLVSSVNPHSLCLPESFEKAIEGYDVVERAAREAGIYSQIATPLIIDTEPT